MSAVFSITLYERDDPNGRVKKYPSKRHHVIIEADGWASVRKKAEALFPGFEVRFCYLLGAGCWLTPEGELKWKERGDSDHVVLE